MPKPSTLKIIVKIYDLPDSKPVADGGREIQVEADGQIVTTTLGLKFWEKLLEGAKVWPSWVAKIEGRMGRLTREGFELLDPDLQVFEMAGKR